jgi:hypothetical protein
MPESQREDNTSSVYEVNAVCTEYYNIACAALVDYLMARNILCISFMFPPPPSLLTYVLFVNFNFSLASCVKPLAEGGLAPTQAAEHKAFASKMRVLMVLMVLMAEITLHIPLSCWVPARKHDLPPRMPGFTWVLKSHA